MGAASSHVHTAATCCAPPTDGREEARHARSARSAINRASRATPGVISTRAHTCAAWHHTHAVQHSAQCKEGLASQECTAHSCVTGVADCTQVSALPLTRGEKRRPGGANRAKAGAGAKQHTLCNAQAARAHMHTRTHQASTFSVAHTPHLSKPAQVMSPANSRTTAVASFQPTRRVVTFEWWWLYCTPCVRRSTHANKQLCNIIFPHHQV